MAALIPKCVNGSVYQAARAFCRQEILEKGLCEIPNFLTSTAVTKILSSAERVKGLGKGFRSSEEHNVYLEDNAETTTAVDTVLRTVSFPSSKVLLNQAELQEDCPELLELFRWPGLRGLLQEAFALPKLFCSADPLGGVYLNFFERGDRLGWHFDRSAFSVNLILRECPRGQGTWPPGAFMYIPDSKGFFDANPNFDLATLQSGSNPSSSVGLNPTVVPDLKPGTLYLFAGHRSLHCVSENTTDTVRVNAIFTYNLEPNVSLNQYTRQKFFGS
ncbi:unnamed protein product [Durusdinium trenchii]|uniref:Serine/threonine-protein phosphatase PP2A catalytic subunit n=2 Tax=Durusdinium trenchii TaxID=1381693 RepID=A0ABP0R0P5_9DINO